MRLVRVRGSAKGRVAGVRRGGASGQNSWPKKPGKACSASGGAAVNTAGCRYPCVDEVGDGHKPAVYCCLQPGSMS